MNIQQNDGGPAFPLPIAGITDDGMYDSQGLLIPRRREFSKRESGISVRDYFAAKAMQAEISVQGMEGCDKLLITGMAYELADAMLRERSKQTTKT